MGGQMGDRAGGASPRPDGPLVLAGREGRRRVVTALDAAAERLGLVAGMAVTKARALVPGLAVVDADPCADARGLERLALWALRFSPIVASDPPDGLVIDTTGADHLHSGEAAMLTAIVERLAAAGIEARAAVADTWGAAHAAARFLGRATAVVPPQGAERVLRPLPVEALRLAPQTVRDLRGIGFERIGDLVDRPRAPLALRFGPDLMRRLDQALGRVAEPVEPVRSPDLIAVSRVFAEPIAAPETIARYTHKLVAALCAGLEARGLGARRLDLLFRRIDNGLQAIRIGTAQPVRDAGRLTRLLCERIETIDPGFGIEAMTLTATRAEPLTARQVAASLADEAEPDISGLIDVLANRVGVRRVYRLAPVASDVPERSVMRIAPLSPATGGNWTGEWPRPPRLLARPEPIDTMALLPDHPPVWFAWRGVRRRVARADGPERVFGEWWKREAELAAVRDYFRVESEAGERYWIFRTGDGEDPETGSHRWFLHGIFA
ncbi:Y-family DNA polymerase [Pseudochelatococcus sp. B33]